MNRPVSAIFLLLAIMVVLCGCMKKKVTPPEMPQYSHAVPTTGASAQEMERYQLEEEKRALSEKYGDNIDRIQQINARLIQLNLEIRRQHNQQ